MKYLLLFVFTTTCLYNTIVAQSGMLDKNFGNNGKLDPGYLDIYGVARTALIQNDGKILLVGQTFYTNDIVMARYLKKGEIDSSFGKNGVYQNYNAGGYAEGNPIAALQKDGKIVVAGTVVSGNNTSYPTVSRYLPNGSIDSSFGKNGVSYRVFNSKEVQAEAIAIQPDNKIVIVGNYRLPNRSVGIMRYTSNGKVDTTFGENHTGVFQILLNKNGDAFWTVVIQPDGKIIAGGVTAGIDPGLDFVMLRTTVDGRPDSTFGRNGVVTTDFCNNDDRGESIALQPDGKIIFAGQVHCGNNYNFGIGRYLPDGRLDSSFGTKGKVITDFSGYDDYATSIAIELNGKIVAGGVSFLSSNTSSGNFALAQYKTNGTLDSSFGNNGTTITDFHGLQDWGYDAALQKDGKIILCGFANTQLHTGFALARYKDDECLINNNCVDTQLKLTSARILSLAPNPVKNILSLSFNSQIQMRWHITISSVYGKVYKNLDWNTSSSLNTKQIDVSFLPTGIYMLNVYTADECYSSKFLKD